MKLQINGYKSSYAGHVKGIRVLARIFQEETPGQYEIVGTMKDNLLEWDKAVPGKKYDFIFQCVDSDGNPTDDEEYKTTFFFNPTAPLPATGLHVEVSENA